MKYGDVFESEGGFRPCLSLHAGGPVISACPWFVTKEEAEIAVMKDREARVVDLESQRGMIPDEVLDEEIRRHS